MKRRILLFAMLASMAALASATDSANRSKWTGVWQGDLDGQPGVIITLGTDPGQVAGTVVFNVISRDNGQPRVIGSDAHVLTHIVVDDDSLQFQVIRLGDARDLHMTMRLTADGKAQFQCKDCGADSPLTELVRAR
jgi:hypothetical protein